MRLFPTRPLSNPLMWTTAGVVLLAIYLNRPHKVIDWPLPTPAALERERQVEAHFSIAEQRRQDIVREIDALGPHDWAGVYTWSSTSCRGEVGESITIAPSLGFVWIHWHGCSLPFDLNYGDVLSADSDKIRVELQLAVNEREYTSPYSPTPTIAAELVRVKWRGRRYLIPSPRVVDFCSGINSGARWMLREFPSLGEDNHMGETTLPRDSPQLPLAYRPLLLSRPIHATVTAVGDEDVVSTHEWQDRLSYQCRCTAFVDAGRVDGLFPGMVLFPDKSMLRCTITDLFDHASKVVFEFYGDREVSLLRVDDKDPREEVPKVRDVLSTLCTD